MVSGLQSISHQSRKGGAEGKTRTLQRNGTVNGIGNLTHQGKWSILLKNLSQACHQVWAQDSN